MMKQFCIVFLCSMCLFFCGRKQESNPIASPESRAFVLERENFFNSLKNPDELASSLVPGMEYDSTGLNNPDHYYSYSTNDILAAANLGIYIADLNYCVLFQEKEQVKKYFLATYELSKVIRSNKDILEFLMKRYQSNVNRNDSVKRIVNQLFEQSTKGLQNTDRERLAGIAMAGYQIETLHLALLSLNSLPETLTGQQTQTKRQLTEYILNQRGKFEVVYQFVHANSDPLDPGANPNYPFFDNALRELIGVYRTVSENDLHISELQEKVDAIRNRIVDDY